MNPLRRRDFLRLAAISPIAYAPLLNASDASPEIAFTFDDPKLDSFAGLRWQDINDRMLHTLSARKLQATLFVCGKRIDRPEGKDLIAQWDRGGHAIANHSYSHLYFNASGGSDANVTLAEFEADALYAVLGLAASEDNGQHWTDLGEIIRLNQAFAPGLDGFEIGDGPLVLSPDSKYFYLYFPDWIANGTLHGTTTTNVSVARALVASVLDAAFASPRHHTVGFQKFYRGTWELQPAIGGASTDLNPKVCLSGLP